MNIGEMITALSYVSNDCVIRNAGTEFCSYRGYYEHLAICNTKEVTVKEFKKVLRKQIGKTYTGYKGGEFLMNLDTELFVANYGSCGLWVTGISIDSEGVFLATSAKDMNGY
jgi:hypothetical protein